MKDAVFTIKTNEIVDLPDPNNTSTGIFKILKYAVWAIVALMIIFSLILGENFFFEISSSARIVLIGLVIGSFVWRDKTIEAPSPMEIRFYDDYLIVYKEKHYYNKKISRMEYYKIFYHDITRLRYEYQLKKFKISGTIDAMWFDYQKDGSVPPEPTYHRIVEGTMCYFYIFGNDEEYIIDQIEKFTGVKADKLT